MTIQGGRVMVMVPKDEKAFLAISSKILREADAKDSPLFNRQMAEWAEEDEALEKAGSQEEIEIEEEDKE